MKLIIFLTLLAANLAQAADHSGVWNGDVTYPDQTRQLLDLDFVSTSGFGGAQFIYRFDSGASSAIGAGLNTLDYPQLLTSTDNLIPAWMLRGVFMSFAASDLAKIVDFTALSLNARSGSYVIYFAEADCTNSVMVGGVYSWNPGTSELGPKLAAVKMVYLHPTAQIVTREQLELATDATDATHRLLYDSYTVFYPDHQLGFVGIPPEEAFAAGWQSVIGSPGTWDPSGTFSVSEGPLVRISAHQLGRSVLLGNANDTGVAGQVQAFNGVSTVVIGDFELRLNP